MRKAITRVHMTLRAAGLMLILLGVTFWTGHALQLVPGQRMRRRFSSPQVSAA